MVVIIGRSVVELFVSDSKTLVLSLTKVVAMPFPFTLDLILVVVASSSFSPSVVYHKIVPLVL